MMHRLKQFFLKNKITFYILLVLVFLSIISIFLNKKGVNDRLSLFENGYYTEAIVTNFVQESRSSFYEYSFNYDNITVTNKCYKRGYTLIIGGKYMVLFNPIEYLKIYYYNLLRLLIHW